MKNTPAVFLTSLAVSAISLTIPMPAASTVLSLFIGEDVAILDCTSPCKERPPQIQELEDEHKAPVHRLPEQPLFIGDAYEATFSRSSNSSFNEVQSSSNESIIPYRSLS